MCRGGQRRRSRGLRATVTFTALTEIDNTMAANEPYAWYKLSRNFLRTQIVLLAPFCGVHPHFHEHGVPPFDQVGGRVKGVCLQNKGRGEGTGRVHPAMQAFAHFLLVLHQPRR